MGYCAQIIPTRPRPGHLAKIDNPRRDRIKLS
jgi:hypothetical protein